MSERSLTPVTGGLGADPTTEDERLRFLSDAGLALVSSLDTAATLQRVAELSIGVLADYCIFDIFEPDSSARRLAWAHRNPRWPRLKEIGRYAPPPSSDHPFAHIAKSGDPVFAPNFDEEWKRRISWSPDHADLMDELQPHSVMFVPLKAHGSTVGAAIFAYSESEQRHTLRDLNLALDLCRRVGLAVLHSRQFEALQKTAERLAGMTAQQRMLIRELNHRVKNTLAVVQALATQTLRSGAPIDVSIETFGSRLRALAKAHDLLTHESWEGADVRAVAALVAEPHQDGGAERIVLEGPSANLGPQLALNLAMILHELATNAVKYGALSNKVGTVELRWTVEGSRLDMCWREIGGPKVLPPKRRGLGTRLIERHLAEDLRTELEFDPSGLRCTMVAELPEILGLANN